MMATKYLSIERLYIHQGYTLIHTVALVEEEIDLAKGFMVVQPAWIPQ